MMRILVAELKGGGLSIVSIVLPCRAAFHNSARSTATDHTVSGTCQRQSSVRQRSMIRQTNEYLEYKDSTEVETDLADN